MMEPTPVLPTAVGKGHAADLADEMVAAEDQNGVVMRGFVQSVVEDALAEWAPALCTALQPESLSMSVYEGLNCDPGESFAAQVRREMQQKIGGLDVQGKVTAEATSTALAAVAKVIESMTQLHGAAVPHGDRQPDMRFKTKIELNQGGACIKYHDDFVDVRLVTTLVGDGTVLADNTEVDWSYYDKCGGHLPAGADDDSGRDFSDTVREWNARVVPSGELACAPGDVGVMKGGMLTKRPCLHRAPYSAEAKKLPRFLVTVERLPADMVQEFYDMEQSMCDCSDCSDDEDTDSDSGDGEDSESNGGDADGKASERDTAE